MICPKCGSSTVSSQAVTITEEKAKIKGFGPIKACLGFLLFSIPGVLCGLCGMGKGRTSKKTRIKVITICQDCGYQW